MKLEFSRQIFEKYSYTDFYENQSSGSQVFFMWTGGQTDMTKLIVAFGNFSKDPQKVLEVSAAYIFKVMVV
jgi:hypothetical protein